VSVSYQLRPQYVGVYGGGQINVGNAGYVFDVGAALTAGGGTIVAADADLATPSTVTRRCSGPRRPPTRSSR
jgi:hypothetical protein